MKNNTLTHRMDRFLFNFHIKRYPKYGYKIMPSSYINRKGEQIYNKFDARKEDTKFNIPIGYCIFYRDKKGKLWGFTEQSFSMEWKRDYVHVFTGIPLRYFHPEDGCFLIKTTRKYKDIELLNNVGHHFNFYFREIKQNV